MRTVIILNKTGLETNKSYEAEPLEAKLRKITETKEPIGMEADMIYTERKQGVEPAYDIRTDRWEIAQMHMGEITKGFIAKRDEIGETKKGGETPANPSDK